MDDFITYFLAGMFGTELIRKVATRPFGFMYLWLMCFVLVNICMLLLFVVFGLIAFLKVGMVQNETILSTMFNFVRDLSYFFFVIIQPWGIITACVLGLVFAVSYHGHYRNHVREIKK